MQLIIFDKYECSKNFIIIMRKSRSEQSNFRFNILYIFIESLITKIDFNLK